MKVSFKNILVLMLMVLLAAGITACGDKEDAQGAADSGQEQTQTADDGTEDADAEPAKEIVKTIEGVDEDLGPREPLMIDYITLYDDGSVAVVPTEDLKKNEIKDDSDEVYPFEESGKVRDIYVVDYGNGGYRTLIALMEDGSISAVNGRALVEDHIFAVMDDVANKDNFVSVENRKEEDGSLIVAKTEDGEEVVLDHSLNFDEVE